MKDPYLIILAAGASTRMKLSGADAVASPDQVQDADRVQKGMIRLGGGRPLLDYLLLNAQAAGYREVLLVIGADGQAVRDRYTGHPELGGLTVRFAEQTIPSGRSKPAGTADALWQGVQSRPEWADSRITVCNSDNLYSVNALRLLLCSEQDNALIGYDSSALGASRRRIAQFAVLQCDTNGSLLAIHEKPDRETYAAAQDVRGRVLVSMNIFRLSVRQVAPFLESVPPHPQRGEKELSTAVHLMVQAQPGSLQVIPLAEIVPDLTSKADIPLVQAWLKREYPEP